MSKQLYRGITLAILVVALLAACGAPANLAPLRTRMVPTPVPTSTSTPLPTNSPVTLPTQTPAPTVLPALTDRPTLTFTPIATPTTMPADTPAGITHPESG